MTDALPPGGGGPNRGTVDEGATRALGTAPRRPQELGAADRFVSPGTSKAHRIAPEFLTDLGSYWDWLPEEMQQYVYGRGGPFGGRTVMDRGSFVPRIEIRSGFIPDTPFFRPPPVDVPRWSTVEVDGTFTGFDSFTGSVLKADHDYFTAFEDDYPFSFEDEYDRMYSIKQPGFRDEGGRMVATEDPQAVKASYQNIVQEPDYWYHGDPVYPNLLDEPWNAYIDEDHPACSIQ